MPEGHQGWLARFTEGMDPKIISAVVTALVLSLGGCYKSAMDLKAEREARAQQVEQVERHVTTQKGRVAARMDSLDRRMTRLERKVSPGRRRPGDPVGPPEPERKGTLLSSLAKLWPF